MLPHLHQETEKKKLWSSNEKNLMFPLWFALLGGSFVFLDVGHSILFLVFPPFLGCFGLFIIGRVSSKKHKNSSRTT
jgi:hypothetical protein